MVQVLADVVVVVSVFEETEADSTSASSVFLYMVSVHIVLYGKMSLGADVADMPVMPAFGEIVVSADSADGAWPPLSGTHYGLQRRCGAGLRKRPAQYGWVP